MPKFPYIRTQLAKTLIMLACGVILYSCSNNKKETSGNANKALQDSVQAYLDGYINRYLQLSIISNEAQWKSNTHIVEGDSSNAVATNKAEEENAKFTGSTENIEAANKYLAQKEKLTEHLPCFRSQLFFGRLVTF